MKNTFPLLIAVGTVAFYTSLAFAEPQVFTVEVSKAEYEKYGIGFEFSGENIVVTGSVAAACLPHFQQALAVKSPGTSSNAKKEDDEDNKSSKKPSIEKMKDLDKVANENKITIQGLKYTAKEGEPLTLDACEDKYKNTPKVDLSTVIALSKSNALEDDDIAFAQLQIGGKKYALPDMKSDAYLKYAEQIKKVNCTDGCNKDEEHVDQTINDIAALIEKYRDLNGEGLLFKEYLNKFDLQSATVSKATGDLVSIRDDLLKTLETINDDKTALSEEHRKELSEKYEALINDDLLQKNYELAEKSKKSDSKISAAADFVVSTKLGLAKASHLDSDQAKTYEEEAEDFEKDGKGREAFVLNFNSEHSELKAKENKLKGMADRQKRSINTWCSVSPGMAMNEYRMKQCNAAQQSYGDSLWSLNDFKSKVHPDQPINWDDGWTFNGQSGYGFNVPTQSNQWGDPSHQLAIPMNNRFANSNYYQPNNALFANQASLQVPQQAYQGFNSNRLYNPQYQQGIPAQAGWSRVQ